ncbi:MAG TPA: hypothetical protein VK866_03535 [Acidimicrobiales bacterium]|nr:hypothetical protein [Acidimicrobiales bacterium]
MERFGAVAAAVERLGELVDLAAGPTEDDRRLGGLHVEDPPERRGLVGAGDHEGELTHQRRVVGVAGRPADAEPLGIAQVALRDLLHA